MNSNVAFGLLLVLLGGCRSHIRLKSIVKLFHLGGGGETCVGTEGEHLHVGFNCAEQIFGVGFSRAGGGNKLFKRIFNFAVYIGIKAVFAGVGAHTGVDTQIQGYIRSRGHCFPVYGNNLCISVSDSGVRSVARGYSPCTDFCYSVKRLDSVFAGYIFKVYAKIIVISVIGVFRIMNTVKVDRNNVFILCGASVEQLTADEYYKYAGEEYSRAQKELKPATECVAELKLFKSAYNTVGNNSKGYKCKEHPYSGACHCFEKQTADPDSIAGSAAIFICCDVL